MKKLFSLLLLLLACSAHAIVIYPIRMLCDQAARQSVPIDLNSGASPQWVVGDNIEFDIGLAQNGTIITNITFLTNLVMQVFPSQHDTNLLMAQLLAQTNGGLNITNMTNLTQSAWTSNLAGAYHAAFTFNPAATSLTNIGVNDSMPLWIRIYGVTTDAVPRYITYLEGQANLFNGPLNQYAFIAPTLPGGAAVGDLFEFGTGWVPASSIVGGSGGPGALTNLTGGSSLDNWTNLPLMSVGTTATASGFTTSGSFTSTAVFTPGSGYAPTPYAPQPTITVNNPDGTGAAFAATVNSSGAITGITVTSPGTGYTFSSYSLTISPPTAPELFTGPVTFQGGFFDTGPMTLNMTSAGGTFIINQRSDLNYAVQIYPTNPSGGGTHESFHEDVGTNHTGIFDWMAIDDSGGPPDPRGAGSHYQGQLIGDGVAALREIYGSCWIAYTNFISTPYENGVVCEPTNGSMTVRIMSRTNLVAPGTAVYAFNQRGMHDPGIIFSNNTCHYFVQHLGTNGLNTVTVLATNVQTGEGVLTNPTIPYGSTADFWCPDGTNTFMSLSLPAALSYLTQPVPGYVVAVNAQSNDVHTNVLSGVTITGNISGATGYLAANLVGALPIPQSLTLSTVNLTNAEMILTNTSVTNLTFQGVTYTAARVVGRRAFTTNGFQENGVSEWEVDNTGTNFVRIVYRTNAVFFGATPITVVQFPVIGWTNLGGCFAVDCDIDAVCPTNITSYWQGTKKLTWNVAGGATASQTPAAVPNTTGSGNALSGGSLAISGASGVGSVSVSFTPAGGSAVQTNIESSMQFIFSKF